MELEEMVARVIDRASIPGRRREPKLATELASASRVDVPTVHGPVAAWRVGEGPAVLLVHGWQDSARLWDPLMAALRERRRAFVALDLPGHGFSGGERCLTAEVPDAVRAVAEAMGPVDAAVAHSFASGGTALAVAEGVTLDRLVLIAPPLAYRAPEGASSPPLDAGRQRWRRIAGELGFDPTVGDRAIDEYLAALPANRATWSFSEGLAALAVDVLFLASRDDDRFDLGPARAIAASLPRGELIELEGLDHRASARDEAAVAAIVGFVDGGG